MTKGIKLNRRLRCLRPILNKWIKLNRKLGADWEEWKDAPWWYNERAHLSVFSGAIWKNGGYAFEEFSGPFKTGKKNPSSGRTDLEFTVDGRAFWAEAKQCWPSDKARRGAKYISGFMDQAKYDAGRCHPDGSTKRLAIVFGSPFFTRHSKPDEIREKIKYLVDQAKEIEADAIAWVFPKLRHLPKHSNRVYPGIIVWIKEVNRLRKKS